MRLQASRRGIDESTLRAVAEAPEQMAGEETVVTVYRTSKIAKYWRAS